MSVTLAANHYGKSRVRLVRVTRDGERHQLKDLCIDIQLAGEFEAAHTRGDNSKVLPTDTMKNTVYVFAGQSPLGEIEEFARRLVDHFLGQNPQLTRARVAIEESFWERIPVNGKPHPWAFIGASRERRTAIVTGTRAGHSVEAGIEDLLVLKSRDSAFTGYLKDQYTTLKETRDRILATIVKAVWFYSHPDVPFGRCWTGVRELLLETFAEHKSESVQHTLYAMGNAVLEAFGEIRQIRLSLPNKHHLLVDLKPFGMENDNEIFVPADEPYGLIEAVLRRE